MKNNYKFSFIICYRHRTDRLNPLKKVIDWINSFAGAEIILVEQDTNSKISELNLDAKHIFIESSELFNKSWGFNVGLKYSTTNKIIFSDTDIVMNPNKFIESINLLDKYDMVSPYNKVIDLNECESNLPMKNIMSINRLGRGDEDIQKINICGGIAMFTRSAIEKIHGWNELFVGWGAEDDFQSIKSKHFLNHIELTGNCYHLYHTRGLTDVDAYKRNLNLFNKYRLMSKGELSVNIKHLNNKGLKNKYQL